MSRKNECGYALLITSAIIMLGVILTALITGRAISYEQKNEDNDYHSLQAFAAAEAGLDYGLAYLNSNQAAILVNDPNNSGFIKAYTNALINNVSFVNNTTYNISYSNPIANNFSLIKIVSQGTADNGSATMTLTQMNQLLPFILNTPPAPLIAQQAISLGGNVTIQTPGTLSIWSGTGTTLIGAASTSAHGGVTSNSRGLNSDVIQNDTGLSNLSNSQFFTDFFGTSPANAQQNANVVYTNNSSTNYSSLLDGLTGQFIWINQTGGTGSFSGNATIGSPTSPVVLVINGPFQANGTTTIYGLVYFTGDWNNSGGGNLNVIGAAIVEGNLSSTGTPNITYDTTVLSNLQNVGNFMNVPGSWHDF